MIARAQDLAVLAEIMIPDGCGKLSGARAQVLQRTYPEGKPTKVKLYLLLGGFLRKSIVIDRTALVTVPE